MQPAFAYWTTAIIDRVCTVNPWTHSLLALHSSLRITYCTIKLVLIKNSVVLTVTNSSEGECVREMFYYQSLYYLQAKGYCK